MKCIMFCKFIGGETTHRRCLVSFEFLSCCEVSFLLFFFFLDFYFLRFRSWPVLSSSVRVLSKICDLFLPPTETKRIKVKQLCLHFLITGSSPVLRLFMYNLKYYFTTCTLCIICDHVIGPYYMSCDTYTRMQASSRYMCAIGRAVKLH